MTGQKFNAIVEEQLNICKNVLCKKADEYATEDRLHNFKVAAALGGGDPIKALSGMMAKHTVSIYDMCRTDENYPIELWNEKITDHINYLLLLKGLVIEGKEELPEFISFEEEPTIIKTQGKTGTVILKPIFLESSEEANRVLHEIVDLMTKNGCVCVADVYEICKVTTKHTFADTTYGWTEIDDMQGVPIWDREARVTKWKLQMPPNHKL